MNNEDDEREEEPRYLGRRVSNLGANVSAWSDQSREGSSVFDLCKAHAEQLEKNPHRFDDVLKPYNGDPIGEDGWGGDVVHPNYDDEWDDCRCAVCGVLLGGW